MGKNKRINKKFLLFLLFFIFIMFTLTIDKTLAEDIEVIYFDLAKGTIEFTDDTYLGTDENGNTITGEHKESNQYVITQTDAETTATTNFISIGTSDLSVTKKFNIVLAGVNVKCSTSEQCAFSVNAKGSSIVAVILKNDTKNILYSGKNRAGLEKSGGATSDGTLLISCEEGYNEWKKNSNYGHTDSNTFSACTGQCGYLDAKSGNSWGSGTETYYAGAGIGTGGRGKGGSNKPGEVAGTNALVNLTIAGGNITATGAYGSSVSNSSGGGASIGTGSASASSTIAGTINGLKITGGNIIAYRGDNSSACIGGGYRSGYVNMEIYGGTIDATQNGSKLTNTKNIRAAGIGGGGGGTSSASPAGATITINGGNINSSGQFSAAIGAGAGGSGGGGEQAIVNINGGKIEAKTTKGSGNGAGAGIGTGGSLGTGRGGEATVNITNGTIIASSELGADIGGGGTNSTVNTGIGGKGKVSITGGTITANLGGIGGGKANAGKGGDAEVIISGGIINASAIGGGDSVLSTGGTATVTVDGNANIILSDGIGGGISQSANGGSANVTVTAGILECGGSIGGGNSQETDGGEAKVVVKGGTLRAKSIGGGNSTSGNGGAAVIEITDGIIKTGSIGGGTTENPDASVGYASALIEGGDITGQFIMAEGADIPCEFIMTGGTLHESNTADTEFIHLQKNGGALYMDDPTGVANLSGGTIKNCFGENGGAVYMTAGVFNLSGDAVIDSCSATANGGAIYLGAKEENKGTFNMFGGTILGNYANNGNGGAIYLDGGDANISGGNIGTETSSNHAKNGGGAYLQGGTLSITDGNFKNNEATENGGGTYLAGGTLEIHGGSFINNTAVLTGGGACINGGNVNMTDGTINNCTADNGGGVYISGGDMTINGGTVNGCQASKGGGIYIFTGNITMNGGIISNNQAREHGGGIYASSDTQNLTINITSGSIIGNIANAHGGGIGINMGEGLSANVIVGLETCKGKDESHSHPVILDNIANEMGGGFCMHGSDMSLTVYCGYVEGNIAIKEAGSANINQTGGIVTVYGGNIEDGIIVIGGKYVYIQNEDGEKGNITYNSNVPGNIQTAQAEISVGVKISIPKNLFTRENYVLVGWATVPSPTETDNIYSAGGSYVIENNDITLYAIWLRIGAGTIKEPIIKSGKQYSQFTGGVNLMITSDSSFTTQMTVENMQPSLYYDRILSFDRPMVKGTFITLIDLSDSNKKKYYYYEVQDEATTNISLNSFVEMGGTQKYINSDNEEFIDETFLFIVSLPEGNTTTGSIQMTLTRYCTDSEVAPIEQTLSYTITPKRTFDLKWKNTQNITLEDYFTLSYEKDNLSGEDSAYDNRKMSIVITGKNGEQIPKEAKLYDGTKYYSLNAEGQFIISFGKVEESKEISLQLISKTLLKNRQNFDLKAELWVSGNDNETNPFMGDKVATIEQINLYAAKLPSFEVNMDKRVHHISDITSGINIEYNSENIEKYKVTLEIQKKNEQNIYETQLNSLSNSIIENKGVFSLDVNKSGQLNLKFANTPQTGTYRILVKIIDKDEILLEIPYNFILLN